MKSSLKLFGYATGMAANNVDCALGPWYMYYHPELFTALTISTDWHAMIHAGTLCRGKNALNLIEENIKQLGQSILPFAQNNHPVCVIGGDHSSAIGTWSAIAHANRNRGDIGLIWIDAHMDSHTPDTSISQNIHGMPVAHLLGFGDKKLSQLFDSLPKIKPENLCIIGVRSYESGEASLLERLGVKVFFMDEIQKRGVSVVLQEAYQLISNSTCGFGISIDLDSIDPVDAPGVGCPEPNGIMGTEIITALHTLQPRHPLLGLEIAEFNPLKDNNGKTAAVLVDLIRAIEHYLK